MLKIIFMYFLLWDDIPKIQKVSSISKILIRLLHLKKGFMKPAVYDSAIDKRYVKLFNSFNLFGEIDSISDLCFDVKSARKKYANNCVHEIKRTDKIVVKS